MRVIRLGLVVTGVLLLGAACNCGVDVASEIDGGADGPNGDAGPGHDGGNLPMDASFEDDADASTDGGEPLRDGGDADGDGGTTDGGPADGGMGGFSDGGPPGVDAGADAGSVDAGTPDAGPPDAGSGPTHVHVNIDNFCNTSVSPTEVFVPLNSGLKLQFHNHSVDYEADIWSSRGYGYLQLARGATWNDPITHCGGPNPYTEYFDISIAGGPISACPGVRFRMHCQ